MWSNELKNLKFTYYGPIPKSKYMAMDWFSISKNPKNSIFDANKQNLILDSFDLNVFGANKQNLILDSFDPNLITGPKIKNLNTWLDSAYQWTPRIQFLLKIKLSLILDPLDLNVGQFEYGYQN